MQQNGEVRTFPSAVPKVAMPKVSVFREILVTLSVDPSSAPIKGLPIIFPSLAALIALTYSLSHENGCSATLWFLGTMISFADVRLSYF